jgi:hypothetical protein
MRSKRDVFGYVAVALATATMTGVLWYALVLPTTLRVAVSPAGGETARLLAALSGEMERQRRPIRLVVIGHEDHAEPALSLDARRVDVAVVRPDYRMPSSGLGVAILQQHVVLAVARRGTEITQFAELRGKRVGTVAALRPSLTLIGAFRALENPTGDEPGPEVFATADEIAEAFAESRVDGAVFVARRGDPELSRVVARIAERAGEPPVPLPIRGAAGFAEGQGTFSAGEIGAGDVSRVPLYPAEAVPTLTFPTLLMARNRLSDNAVEELTRQLFTLRPALAAEHPLAARIEALSTERGSGIAVHPGAATYYDANERGFLDRYSDLLWLALFGFGGIASAGAFLLRLLFPREREASRTDHARLKELLSLARRVESLDGLADLERQIDEQIVDISLAMLEGSIDKENKPAFDLVIDQLRTAVAQRRAELQAAPTRTEVVDPAAPSFTVPAAKPTAD